MFLLSSVNRCFRQDCSRSSGLKSSLNHVHLRIHHVLKVTSYRTDSPNMPICAGTAMDILDNLSLLGFGAPFSSAPNEKRPGLLLSLCNIPFAPRATSCFFSPWSAKLTPLNRLHAASFTIGTMLPDIGISAPRPPASDFRFPRTPLCTPRSALCAAHSFSQSCNDGNLILTKAGICSENHLYKDICETLSSCGMSDSPP